MATCVSDSDRSFGEAVQYALEQLKSSHLTPRKEQLLSIKAVYERKSVFVWLPTGSGKACAIKHSPL